MGGAKIRKGCSGWKEGAAATKDLAEKEQFTRKPGERSGASVGQRQAAPEPGKKLGNTEGFEARIMR